MRSSVIASVALHVAVVILATVGLPSLLKPPAPEPVPLVVELVTISDVTNVPTKPREPEPKKEEPKPEPPKPEPPKPVETPPPPPTPTPPKPEPKAAEAPSPPPPEPTPTPKPLPKAEEPKPEPKPVAPQELANTKPAKKPKAPQEDFDSVLKNLAKSLPQQKAEPKAEKKAEPKTNFDDLMSKAIPSNRRNIADPTKPLTMTEQDAIKNIFTKAMARCWNPPVGAKDAKDLVVNIRINLAEDGTVLRAAVDDSGLGKSDFWRAAAESARRAVLVCSPFSELPRNLYPQWKESVLSFNPAEMFGG